MSSRMNDILCEWEGGSYYNDQYLSEAYTQMLLALMDASPRDRADDRVVPFLLVGYLAYMREQAGADPHALITFRMALAMVGQGSMDPPARTNAAPAQPQVDHLRQRPPLRPVRP